MDKPTIHDWEEYREWLLHHEEQRPRAFLALQSPLHPDPGWIGFCATCFDAYRRHYSDAAYLGNRKGRPNKYPWSEWFDGRPHKLIHDRDFPDYESVVGFQRFLHGTAAGKGFRIATRTEGDGIVIQVSRRTEDAKDHVLIDGAEGARERYENRLRRRGLLDDPPPVELDQEGVPAGWRSMRPEPR